MLFWGAFAENVSGQKHDQTWVLGSPMALTTFVGDTLYNNVLPVSNLNSFITIGNICDTAGNLLFFTNGVRVYDRIGRLMPNGDSLSYPSKYYDQIVYAGMPSHQGVLILPKPDSQDSFYIFHYTPTDTLISGTAGYEALNFYFSIVDMRENAGFGGLVAKNVPIIENEMLSFSRLSACKHANGRDWWIVKNAWHTNIYYTFLLSPRGVEGPFVQQIGPYYGVANEQSSYAMFSPDGSKYSSFTSQSAIVIMEFDRCTGLLSNPRTIFNQITEAANSHSGGVSGAFSPNSRYLYICDRLSLNQYDLLASRWNDSTRLITLQDTSDFYYMNILQLAPNGRIYASCWNGGSSAIHVIEQPDSLGLACNFRLYGQITSSVNSVAIPYFPNFRLQKLSLSPCDTLTSATDISEKYPAFAVIGPNPAEGAATVYFQGSSDAKDYVLEVFDISGKSLQHQQIGKSSGSVRINFDGYPSGTYIVRFGSVQGLLLTERILVHQKH